MTFTHMVSLFDLVNYTFVCIMQCFSLQRNSIHLKFVLQIINETVRLANIAPWIFRKVIKDVEMKGKP